MLNKLGEFIRQYALIQPGDRVTCAVSGGADSIALLWGLYLLKDRLGITLAAAHFNHSLRGEESDQAEAFVRTFCKDYHIPCYVEKRQVIAGPKGLEAAAREARYNFFATLPGKIATAHTADDNAETVMMHLVRGTGLKGLGAIAPINGQVIRPMLSITRREVLAFLEEYHLQYVTDSSNETDAFLRNRIRHHVMPLLKQENPRLAENLSAMALRLRQDEAALAQAPEYRVEVLRQMPQAMRLRAIAADLESWGVPEPEAAHLELVEKLILSDHPSARADLPGGVTVCRNYGVLERYVPEERISPVVLKCPGQTVVEALGLRVICEESEDLTCGESYFTVSPRGEVIVRSRQSADRMRLSGGSKSLKKLFVDRKIPAAKRMAVPVIADDDGILGVYGIGVNLDRLEPGIRIRFESL
jgi:tRNA(Ile)-lysidine synthase